MINLSRDNRAICSGCTVCTHLCPEQCISMKKDKMGFSYPEVDGVNGVDCGLGERVCPGCKDFQMEDNSILESYAARSWDDSVRLVSSSGGLFIHMCVWRMLIKCGCAVCLAMLGGMPVWRKRIV